MEIATAAACRERGVAEYGSPYPLAYDEHKTFRNTRKITDRTGSVTDDILLSKGTEALTPQMRSAYSSG